jgi:hypothetical protein
MNRDRLQGKWKQFGGFVREQWGRLTNDRMRVIAGRLEDLRHQDRRRKPGHDLSRHFRWQGARWRY